MIEGSYRSGDLYTTGQLVDGLQQKKENRFSFNGNGIMSSFLGREFYRSALYFSTVIKILPPSHNTCYILSISFMCKCIKYFGTDIIILRMSHNTCSILSMSFMCKCIHYFSTDIKILLLSHKTCHISSMKFICKYISDIGSDMKILPVSNNTSYI